MSVNPPPLPRLRYIHDAQRALATAEKHERAFRRESADGCMHNAAEIIDRLLEGAGKKEEAVA